MTPFEYVRPRTVTEALAAATAVPGGTYLAGGTNLLDLMKGRVLQPVRVIDLNHIAGLDRVQALPDGCVRIGALVRNAHLAHDREFAARYPAVAEAILSGASPQLRNAATVGGNLLQRTRCRYFHDIDSRCNRREPGAGCDAIDGINHGHAVLGWGDACIATHASDLCVALVALGAIVEIEGLGGPREVPLEDLHRLPGDAPHLEHALGPSELVVAIRLPADAADYAGNARYLKVRDRTSFAFALVSAAAALRIEGGVIAAARLALGGVAARPWRCYSAEASLAGKAPEPRHFIDAAELALAGARPSGDNAYKIELSKRVIVSTLGRAALGTPQRLPALPGSAFGDAGHDVAFEDA